MKTVLGNDVKIKPFQKVRSQTTMMRKVKKEENDIIENFTKEEFQKLKDSSSNFERKVCDNINEQRDNFLKMKEQKKRRKKPSKLRISIHKLDSPSTQRKSNVSSNNSRRNSKYHEVVDSLDAGEEKKEEIFKEIIELNDNKNKLIQIKMDEEIEEISRKLMKELEDAKDEIKISYAEDMKDIDETVFPDLFNGMKEDMENDLESIKEKYEDQKFFEIEKIKVKYLKMFD